MAPRPYWTGTIRLSLVVLPVQIYSAINSSGNVRFHQVHKPTGKRVRHQNVVPGVGPVEREDIVKGYEYSKDQYVLIDPEELQDLRLESKNSFAIVQFVDRTEIDAIYFDDPYYVVPDGEGAQEAFAVVREALRAAKKVGLGQIVVGGRERIAALQPCSKGMMLETLRYDEDLKKAHEFFSGIEVVKVDKDQLSLAGQLIEQKSAPFEPEKFKDRYEDAVRDLIQRRMKGKRVHIEPEAKKGGEVIDFMEALRRSLGKSGAVKRAAPAKAGGRSGRSRKRAETRRRA
jgi:DNA end-binding protein Ku